MRRIAATLLPLVLVGGLIAADGDDDPTMVECDNDVLAQGETDEFTIQASPIPWTASLVTDEGPRESDGYEASTVRFEAAYTNDVDALRGIATITFDWDSPGAASDIDIYVFDSEGSQVADSTSDNTLEPTAVEQVLLSFQPCEVYTFDVQNWAAVNAPEITVTTTVDAKYPRR